MGETPGTIEASPQTAGAAFRTTASASPDTVAGMPITRRNHAVLGATVVGALTLVYTLLYWNRFLSPSAGATFYYAAQEILRGKMPYRDFLFLGTPLHALKFVLLIKVFGNYLVVPRSVAMLERVILAVIVYYWLVRFCRVSSAAFATVFCMLVFSGDAGDSLSSYHHDAVFYAAIAGFCGSVWLESRSARTRHAVAFASGLFAGLCFATKQTIGLGVFAAIPSAIGLLCLRRRTVREGLRFTLLYFVGWFLPNGVILLWLYMGGALRPFYESVFLTHGSKGSVSAILSRPFNQFPGLFPEVAFATVILAGLIRRFRNQGKPESARVTMLLTVGLAAAFALGTISACTAAMWPGSINPPEPFQKTDFPSMSLLSILMVLWHWGTLLLPITGSMVILLGLLYGLLRGPLKPRSEHIFLMAGVSLAVAYFLALSWQSYCPMVIPGVALIVALALERLESSSTPALVAAAVFFCFLSYYYVATKLSSPYLWMFWREPRVTLATHESKLPQLRGILVSEPGLAYAEHVTDLIVTHSSASDTLLVYPYFPIFYVLANRQAPTFIFNHYIDVAPDEICRQDAQRLRSHPPAVIVYMKEKEEDLANDEKVFRMGQKSGSREIVRAIEDITANYKELYKFKVPGSIRWIYVYSRN